jgi:hypothetical protein
MTDPIFPLPHHLQRQRACQVRVNHNASIKAHIHRLDDGGLDVIQLEGLLALADAGQYSEDPIRIAGWKKMRQLLEDRPPILIHCGSVSNQLFKDRSYDAALLFRAGQLDLPFPTVMFQYYVPEISTTCLTYFSRRKDCIVAAEVQFNDLSDGNLFSTVRAIAVLPRSWGEVNSDGGGGWKFYGVPVFDFRFGLLGHDDLGEQEARMTILAGEIASMADPGVVLSMLLASRGIPKVRTDPPVKLQKARRRRGKALLAPVIRVDLSAYREAGPTAGGIHASPVMHLRRGHIRRLPAGRLTWVRDTIVNAETGADKAALAGRRNYEVELDGALPSNSLQRRLER